MDDSFTMRSVILTLGGLLNIIHPSAMAYNDDLIIGGNYAYIEDFPFIVSIQKNHHHVCGGSLVSKNLVLTACHCLTWKNEKMHLLEYRSVKDFTLLAGTVKVHGNEGERRKAHTFFKDPRCDKEITGWVFDLGIVKVSLDFDIKPHQIEILPLPASKNPNNLDEMSRNRADCVTAGWGKLSEQGPLRGAPYLMKVELELIPHHECRQILQATTMRLARNDTDKTLMLSGPSQVCTIGENGKDACSGDSGAPLLCNDGLSGLQVFPIFVRHQRRNYSSDEKRLRLGMIYQKAHNLFERTRLTWFF